MEIYVKNFKNSFGIHIFSGFQSYTLILPVSQFQTQQLIASQVRSHREFNRNLKFLFLILIIDEKSITGGF